MQASRPETLTASATELGQKASALATQIDSHRANIDGLRSGWQGGASDAAIAKAQPTLARMQQIHEALTRAQTALQDGGTALSQTRTSLIGAVDQLKTQGWQVAPDGTVSVRPGSPLDQYAKISPANAMKLQQLAATNSLNVKTQLASFDTTDRQLNQNLRGAVGGLDSAPQKFGPGGTPLPQAPYDTGSEIPVGKDPKDVKEWWKALPQDKKDQLLRDWPDKLGNLNGIPVVDRDKANRTIMQQDIDRPAEVAKSRGVTKEEVLAHPEKYGMAGAMMDRYNNALKVQEALTKNAERTGAPTFLQVYEPEKFKGDGRAAIAMGDPDHADNTAVVVPGTGNDVGAGWLGGDDAVNLYNESKAADRAHSTAVVAWMGYDAPDSLIDPRIGATALAHEGGQLLAADVNALNTTHEGNGHMTVLGHSYGSTTVSDAAAGYGMHTDDVVLVGCPGTDMAHSAADFHLNEGGHLYVGAASSDPITLLGSGIPQTPVPGTGWSVALGDDPALDGYGSTRFKAEVPGFTAPWSDHSQYYAPSSESLFSMSDIVSGHGDALEHDGMTARHRIPQLSGVPVLSDPETYRSGTSGHTHQ
ncbi:alpha/beta hydrolase [Mycobacterium sp. 21AC1]|uniref:alpha/beta hydrolase n=1 Tax=[Mycobacterium] appelbergii TaxID=2939269 RepID=UPI0029394464|nr:alpha/beta hydrolase [Mycobacterium sp. 21AC1]MDV3123349.1 alpha/beta hydrolase [Mycobacterium sp. 21AC1]